MFIGHFAVGFAAKRAAPNVPLVALFGAAQLADLLWPFLLMAGIEQVRVSPGDTAFTPLDFVSYPYSHSLLLLAVWGVAFGYIYKAATNASSGAFAVLAALVVSHWILDVVTHRPDMPVYPGGPKVGLGLWNSVAATIAIEVAMFVVGFVVYMRTTRPRDQVGRWAIPGLAGLLCGGYLANIGAAPPPSVTVLAIVAAVGAAVIMLVTWWADRHREPIG
jgi:membrane-bound metal-dependent hydrolase YbcI (DUF457 family)